MKANGARKPRAARLRRPALRDRRGALLSPRLPIGSSTARSARCATATSPTTTSASSTSRAAFELPLACRKLIDTERFDALVALGAVVRGETPHFDFVAGECARGIMDVQLATGVPIGFGVLTTENLAQAQERADPKRGNKGYAAALAAASLLSVTSNIPRAGFR